MEAAVTAEGARIDSDADFGELFARHGTGALRLATLLCGDRQQAEDAVSEAFARVWVVWRTTRLRNPRAYVRKAVVNEVRNRHRRRALESREAQRRTADQRGQRTHDDTVADRDHVLGLLDQLPHRQRTAVVLRYYEDLTEADTAALMRCPKGTVKSLTSRGLARLRVLHGVEDETEGGRP